MGFRIPARTEEIKKSVSLLNREQNRWKREKDQIRETEKEEDGEPEV